MVKSIMRGPSGTNLAESLGDEVPVGGATSGSGSSAEGVRGMGECSLVKVASRSTATLYRDKGGQMYEHLIAHESQLTVHIYKQLQQLTPQGMYYT